MAARAMRAARNGAWLALLLLCVAAADSPPAVSVVREQLTFGIEYTFTLNTSVEYILDYAPNEEEGQFPSRVWVSAAGGDAAQPVLVTARQAIGAVTWQLPYTAGTRQLHSLQRTLCPHDSLQNATDCAGEVAGLARGAFSLHVGSTCAGAVPVAVRADVARDWRLAFQRATPVTVSLDAPRVYFYQFEEEQQNVRLVLESEDAVCATVSVQEYLCPILQTLAEVETTMRMSMERSAATQVSRERFPHGFYVAVLVRDSDTACRDEAEPDDAWLWEDALLGQHRDEPLTSARIKNLSIKIEAALTARQYVLAAGVTVATFTFFYLAFFATLLARRWPPFARLVQPKAVLADTATADGASHHGDAGERARIGAGNAGASRRRRGSDATFDSSDMSDSDEEQRTEATAVTPPPATPPGTPAAPGTVPASPRLPADHGADTTVPVTVAASALQSPTNGTTVADTGAGVNAGNTSTPFGLPARLRLAALARRHQRVLRARSDRYLYTLLTVSVFYALPVVQFVVAFQIVMNVWGSLDLCYYNFLCAHPVGGLSDFNHVFSNLGYLLLGALFVLQVHVRRARRELQPKHEDYGIPAHYGLQMAQGACMMMVAVLSATYHVCPNRLNFQFDTAFMYVLAVLSMVKIYQSRHPDVNARAHVTFGALAVLIALVVWGVLGGGALFWSCFTVLHVFTFLLLSLRIYYLGQFRLETQRLATAARELRQRGARGLRPLYTARLLMLLAANAVNWAFALYGLLTQQADFASHLLQVLLGNTLLYMVFYLVMKLVHGERPRWYAWGWLAGASLAWAPALYFFLSGSSDWSAPAAVSRHSNHDCKLLQFYDNHDLWHLLSAAALYFSFNAMLTWDDGLAAVRKEDIPVF